MWPWASPLILLWRNERAGPVTGGSLLDRPSLGTVFLVGVIVASIAGRIRPHYAWAYALMSNLAFLAYGLDKSAAVADRWRWSEKSLHWIALLCGWPGALIGQHAFRHKSRKASFLFFTWLASAANAAIFAHLTGFYRWSWQ